MVPLPVVLCGWGVGVFGLWGGWWCGVVCVVCARCHVVWFVCLFCVACVVFVFTILLSLLFFLFRFVLLFECFLFRVIDCIGGKWSYHCLGYCVLRVPMVVGGRARRTLVFGCVRSP